MGGGGGAVVGEGWGCIKCHYLLGFFLWPNCEGIEVTASSSVSLPARCLGVGCGCVQGAGIC